MANHYRKWDNIPIGGKFIDGYAFLLEKEDEDVAHVVDFDSSELFDEIDYEDTLSYRIVNDAYENGECIYYGKGFEGCRLKYVEE